MKKMKTKLLVTLMALISFSVFAQNQENRYSEITNPKLVNINKLAPRSSFFSFTSATDAKDASFASKGSNVLLLNGTWKFNYTENFNEALSAAGAACSRVYLEGADPTEALESLQTDLVSKFGK